jgi:hypothetical protein
MDLRAARGFLWFGRPKHEDGRRASKKEEGLRAPKKETAPSWPSKKKWWELEL